MEPIRLAPPGGSEIGGFREVANEDGSKSWVLGVSEPTAVKASIDGKPVEAELHQAGALAGISDIEIGGVQVGAPFIGGGAAVLVTEIIDGVLGAINVQGSFGGVGFDNALVQALIKGGAALAVNSNISKDFIGSDAASFGAGLIVFDAARGLIPIDTTIQAFIRRLFSGIGNGSGGGAGGTSGFEAFPMNNLDAFAGSRLELAGV